MYRSTLKQQHHFPALDQMYCSSYSPSDVVCYMMMRAQVVEVHYQFYDEAPSLSVPATPIFRQLSRIRSPAVYYSSKRNQRRESSSHLSSQPSVSESTAELSARFYLNCYIINIWYGLLFALWQGNDLHQVLFGCIMFF